VVSEANDHSGVGAHQQHTAADTIRALARTEGVPVAARHVCGACATAMSASGAALYVVGYFGLAEAVYTTDPVSEQLAELQLTLGEGPGTLGGEHSEAPRMTTSQDESLESSARTRIGRLPERQINRRAELYRILDAAFVAHLAVVRDGFPVVVPFACARDRDHLLLHGSTGAGVLRAAASAVPVSVAVTLVDGLVVARSVFDNSMNYRSVVAFGVPTVLEGEEKIAALRTFVDRLLPGRWEEVRPSTSKELAATLMLRLPLDEVSVKIRAEAATAGPDDGEDPAAWAGIVPLFAWAGDAVPHHDVPAEVAIPDSVAGAVERIRTQSAHAWHAAGVEADPSSLDLDQTTEKST
jgi:nitroimidazol reductase NimA-like FMN-containing flavoprotein (pyridoxamine 5'-phosphate oxidase superfamily)